MEPSPPPASASRRGGEAGTGGVMEPKQSEAADRLSSLPAELRDAILVRLDLRDAVRTSVLSRTWRHLWKSLSVLFLSFPSGTHPSVVDSVLLPYIGPRVSFFNICVDEASAGRIDDWLVALSRCSVESIRMSDPHRSVLCFNLHSSIFSFGDLVSLWLQRCDIPPLPVGFAGFPALQDLYLSSVRFPANGENQLEAIIRRSPLLRVLRLFDVFHHDDRPESVFDVFHHCDSPESVIEAPNLRRLRIYSDMDCGWRIGELPCLEDAEIRVYRCTRQEHGFGDFLARFAHVQKLTLYLPVDTVEIPYTLPFTFSNLKNLRLSMDFIEMRPILFMFSLLRSCHNLENLEMEFIESVDQSFEGNWEFLNALWSDDMCANLQTVKMIYVNWLPKQISFMKLILSKARLLRTLYVDKCPDVFDEPKIELLQCKRASAQAHVLFEGLVQQY